MRIALDVMGTDSRPIPDIEGAVLAAREYAVQISLVGPASIIQRELSKYDTSGLDLTVVDALDEIKMDDKPSSVLKSKHQSSMYQAMMLVQSGIADAFVTMGNTGAAHALATLETLRRIQGVKRPALSTIYPVNGRNVVLLDMGANPDAKPDWLAQFAMMGSIYAKTALKYANPRVATLSNGEEEGKGNDAIRQTQTLLQNTPLINYVGHIEPNQILADKADVIVMDGFVGNIFLKTFEGTIRYFADVIREEVTKSWVSKLGALLSRNAFRRVKQRFDTEAVGGAPLLGVNGVVIIGHGSANARGVKSAIHQAIQAVQGGTVQAIREGIPYFELPKVES